MQTLSFTVKLPKNLKNEVSDYNDYFQVSNINYIGYKRKVKVRYLNEFNY